VYIQDPFCRGAYVTDRAIIIENDDDVPAFSVSARKYSSLCRKDSSACLRSVMSAHWLELYDVTVVVEDGVICPLLPASLAISNDGSSCNTSVGSGENNVGGGGWSLCFGNKDEALARDPPSSPKQWHYSEVGSYPRRNREINSDWSATLPGTVARSVVFRASLLRVLHDARPGMRNSPGPKCSDPDEWMTPRGQWQTRARSRSAPQGWSRP
jgi:hypothetical protein